MSSLINFSNNPPFSSSPSSINKIHSNNNVLSMSFLIHPRRQHPYPHLHLHSVAPPNLVVSNETASLRVSCLFQRSAGLGFVRRRGRTKVWEGGGGDPDLEAEVLEFMKTSRNPDLFPSKEELIVAGRLDLVKRIVQKGGWLSYGWGIDDDDDDEEVLENGVQIRDKNTTMGDNVNGEFLSSDNRIYQNRFDGGCNSLDGFEAGSFEVSSSSPPSSPSYSPSSSGRMGGGEDAGIEGILSRLEKERTWSFGFGSKDKESKVHALSNDDDEDLKVGIPEVNCSESSSSVSRSSGKDLFDDSGGMHFQKEYFSNRDESRNPLKPDMWRKWSNRRAGFSDVEFEAAEFGEHIIRKGEMVPKGANETGNLRTELTSSDREKNYKQIRSRIQHMELELASLLRLLCQTDIVVSDKVLKKSSKETHSLSDAWEFRETEIMNARDTLRSLRAQLAVLEGKMALKIVQVQKMVDMKQKKIHAVQKALSLLQTAYVVWPKSATEVLLVGSFDGWTSQRRMEKTSPGVFSLYLKLYPGLYEIKFIVDGVWMIDPLRPIVKSNGHKNNLLVVS